VGKRLLAGVISDFHPTLEGYGAICDALRHAADALAVDIETRWLPTGLLCGEAAEDLLGCDALWCGPWGPYQNTEAALGAIRFARERGLPFMGTCAGFQHAAIEYARSVLGLLDAEHAESNPAAVVPLIAPLASPLIDRTAAVVLDPASRAARIYRRTTIAESYRCSFGLNPEYLSPLHRAGLRVTGVDQMGAATVVECPMHPFFVATLFMPERASRPSAPHPLILEYVRAAVARSATN